MTSPDAPNSLVIARAVEADHELLARLLQLYLYDFSDHAGYDVDERGEFHYAWLEEYWRASDRHAFLIRVGGHPAGFALVRSGNPSRMAEFFVLRKHRRTGVGTQAARTILEAFPGPWSITQLATNAPATRFWRRAIPVHFDEVVHPDGHVEQTFTITSPVRTGGRPRSSAPGCSPATRGRDMIVPSHRSAVSPRE
ncbi:GNAT family N-acetyltransferase [Brachybacterium tyrofermentans]|uniref:GNAT family N-acetyltransferase n=1 Tax=Brachybacterium TaxID=43668 RepID=UPI003F93F0A6